MSDCPTSTALDMIAAYPSKRDVALVNLKRAVEFFDKVKAATADEKSAVGADHWDWLESAARDVVASL